MNVTSTVSGSHARLINNNENLPPTCFIILLQKGPQLGQVNFI